MLCDKTRSSTANPMKMDRRDKQGLLANLGIRTDRKTVFEVGGLFDKAYYMLIYLIKGQVMIF